MNVSQTDREALRYLVAAYRVVKCCRAGIANVFLTAIRYCGTGGFNALYCTIDFGRARESQTSKLNAVSGCRYRWDRTGDNACKDQTT